MKSGAPRRNIGRMGPNFPRCGQQRLAALALGCVCLILAGCGTLTTAEFLIRDASLADHCADFMQRAYPGGGITITQKQSHDVDNSILVAEVQGIKKDAPPGSFLARDLAAVCRFQNNILVDFHWTAGPFRQ